MRRAGTWRSPIVATPGRIRRSDDRHAVMEVAVRVRRWHPALWWLAIRMVGPRRLWRPAAWLAIARAVWRLPAAMERC